MGVSTNKARHTPTPTILWTEARAVTGGGAAPVAKFIYEDIICRFGCIPYFTFDGGLEFQGEVTHLLETLYQLQ